MTAREKLSAFLSRVSPQLLQLYRYHRHSRPLQHAPEFRQSLGFRFNGPRAMELGEFETNETRVFDALMPRFDALINVGANTGYYCLRALQGGKEVYAFEPNPLNVRILLRNVEANQFDAPFHLFPIALGDSAGILPLYGGNTGASLVRGWAGQTNSELVPINTLDNVLGASVAGKRCFVVIDIEGAELHCLRGGLSLVQANDRNAFLVEITVTEHQPDGTVINPHLLETFALLFAAGYRAYAVGGALREVVVDEVRKVAETGVGAFGTHNFLFLGKGLQPADVGL